MEVKIGDKVELAERPEFRDINHTGEVRLVRDISVILKTGHVVWIGDVKKVLTFEETSKE